MLCKLQASCKAPALDLPQVLLNLEPRSFAAACQPTSWQQIKWSVIPPGVTIADEILPPDLVSAPPGYLSGLSQTVCLLFKGGMHSGVGVRAHSLLPC